MPLQATDPETVYQAARIILQGLEQAEESTMTANKNPNLTRPGTRPRRPPSNGDVVLEHFGNNP